MLRCRNNERASVVLVALCFVTVLGISVAGYLALSSQAMNLSNRSFQSNVSVQLAEAGVERALSAFNRNDWSGWTISGTTATRTLTFASDKYGASGLAPAIKLRVDNYDAYMGSAVWSSSTAYSVGDVVGYNGVWYRCALKNTNSTPSATSVAWIHEKSPINFKWSSETSYDVEDVVQYAGNWYRCIDNHTNQAPPNAKWTLIPKLEQYTASAYAAESIVVFMNQWFRWNGTGWVNAPISWRWTSSRNFVVGDYVQHAGIWYRCISDHDNEQPPNTTFWANAQVPESTTTSAAQWLSTSTYRLNDVVYYSGTWYRCIIAHTNQQPPNATYWVNQPLRSHFWTPGKDYAANSVVLHNSVWYRATAAHTSASGTPPPSGSWASAATTNWNSGTSYSVNNYASYGGVWYRCILAHSNRVPTNATYWTAVNAPVIYAEGSATPLQEAPIVTQLRATVVPVSVFTNAAAASNELKFQAGTVDSYDSSAGTYAAQVNGTNNFSARLAGGATSGSAVAINSSLVVNGYVSAPGSSSAPHDPLATIAVSATVKGTSAVPTPKVDASRVSRSPYIPQPAVQDISGGTALAAVGGWPTGGIDIGIPDAVSPTVYYVAGNLSLTHSSKHILNIKGPVVLDVQGNLSISGGSIVIATNGSAEIHFSGTLTAADTGLVNNTSDPKKLVIIGSGTGSGTISQTADLYGGIYFPDGSLTISSTLNIHGAVSAENVTFSTTANLHYDKSLRHVPIRGAEETYSVDEMRELSTPAEKVTF